MGNANSTGSAVSDDGRYVAFHSFASNLVEGDTNGVGDIFLRDLTAGTTIRVSVSSTGAQASSGYSNFTSDLDISGDGRYVVFSSLAPNLVAGDTNGYDDIFVRDTQAGTTTRVSVSSSGAQANNFSADPAISSNGRYVVFTSGASNLTSGDTNNNRDVFIRDLTAGTTAIVSLGGLQGNAQGNGWSFSPDVSDNGRYVAFQSTATNLVVGDTNSVDDIFVRDRNTGTTTRASVDSNELQSLIGGLQPSLSADGRYVAFASSSPNLVVGDTNGKSDVFVRDRTAGTTTRASVSSGGAQVNNGIGSYAPSISNDGTYVAFHSDGSNLVAGDVNGSNDVFVRNTFANVTTLASLNAGGSKGNDGSFDAAVSRDGRWVPFDSVASNLVSGDTNSSTDVFLRDMGELNPPTISGYSASPSRISPNSDGITDSTVFSASLSDASPPISWTLTVKDASATVVRSWSGQTVSSMSQTWDGTDSTGGTLPDGAYTATLTAVDDWSNSSVATTTVWLDTVAPAIPFETMNPPYGGNTMLSPMPLTAKIMDPSGVTGSSVQFKLDGLPVATSWNSTTGWARTTSSQAFLDGSTHTAEITATDLVGNTATHTWTFKKIRFSPQPGTFTLFGTGADSGQAGSLPGTRRWTFDGVVSIGERWLQFPDGSRHPGWGTLASTLPLNAAKVVITDVTGTRDWVNKPYAGVVKTVYQQMSYTSLNGDPRATYVAPTGFVLPTLSMDLPTSVTAASLVLGSDEQPVQTLASAVGVCSDATISGAIAGCSADPLRVFLGKNLASEMDTYVAPDSSAVGNPPAELPVQLAFGVMQQVPDPLDPVPYSDGGVNGVWRDLESTLSPPCIQNPITAAVCEFEGVQYPSGLPPFVPTSVATYCEASAFCYDSTLYEGQSQTLGQTQTSDAQRAPKHDCIAIIGNPQTKWPWPGMDKYYPAYDGVGEPPTCTQGWGSALPLAGKNGALVGAYQMWGAWASDWGFEDGPADEMGLNFVGTFRKSDGKYTHVPWQPDYAVSNPAVYTSHVYPYDGVYPQDGSEWPLPDAFAEWQTCADPKRVRRESAYMYLAEGGQPPYGFGTGLNSQETGDYTKHGWDQYYRIGPGMCTQYNTQWAGYVFIRHRSSQIIGNVIAYTYPGYTFGKTRADGRLSLTYGHVVRSYSYSWKTLAQCATESSPGGFAKCGFFWFFFPDNKDTEERHYPPVRTNAFTYKSNY